MSKSNTTKIFIGVVLILVISIIFVSLNAKETYACPPLNVSIPGMCQVNLTSALYVKACSSVKNITFELLKPINSTKTVYLYDAAGILKETKTITPQDKTFIAKVYSTKITISIPGTTYSQTIVTDCSVPIGPDYVFDEFKVVSMRYLPYSGSNVLALVNNPDGSYKEVDKSKWFGVSFQRELYNGDKIFFYAQQRNNAWAYICNITNPNCALPGKGKVYVTTSKYYKITLSNLNAPTKVLSIDPYLKFDYITAFTTNCPNNCVDNDHDGYNQSKVGCGVADCNDNNNLVYPGANEICSNGIDNDCDGLVDESCPNATYKRPCGDVDKVDNCVWDKALPLGSEDTSGCNLEYKTYWPLNTNNKVTCNFNGSNHMNYTLFASVDNSIINCTLNGKLIIQNYNHENCALSDPRLNIDGPLPSKLNSSIGINTLICYVKDIGSMSHFDACVVSKDLCVDNDHDGYNQSKVGCGVADCNDNNNLIYPNALEKCNNIDDNCNNQIDETFSLKGQICDVGIGGCANGAYYICDQYQTGLVCNATPKIPKSEICNNLDDDCDGLIDENLVCCIDTDHDGFNLSQKLKSCSIQESCFIFTYLGETYNGDGSVTQKFNITNNCNRGLSYALFELNPGVIPINSYTIPNSFNTEITNSPFYGIKFECIQSDCFKNGGSAVFAYTINSGVLLSKVRVKAGQITSYVTFNQSTCSGNLKCGVPDCNDTNSSFYPNATEICDSKDDDCDGLIDEGLDCETTCSGIIIDGKFDEACYNNFLPKCDNVARSGAQVGNLFTNIDSNGDINVYYVQDKSVNDNTYGTGAIGWPSGHKFGDLTGSDKARFVFKDKNGNIVLDFDCDYITSSTSFPSGYGSLGASGGDGHLYSGNALNILATKSSLDYNFNVKNYVLTVNSPKTNSDYDINSTYPDWIYDNAYEVKISKNAFGSVGFGSVEVTAVHDSPPKDGNGNVISPSICPVIQPNPCDVKIKSAYYYKICEAVYNLTFRLIKPLNISTQVYVYKDNDLKEIHNITPSNKIFKTKVYGSDMKYVVINTKYNQTIHTACDQPLDVGMVFDEFELIDWDYKPKADANVTNFVNSKDSVYKDVAKDKWFPVKFNNNLTNGDVISMYLLHKDNSNVYLCDYGEKNCVYPGYGSVYATATGWYNITISNLNSPVDKFNIDPTIRFDYIYGIDKSCINCMGHDLDHDNYSSIAGCGLIDCNDTNPNIHPNAIEICSNHKDDDCDGQIDEGCFIPVLAYTITLPGKTPLNCSPNSNLGSITFNSSTNTAYNVNACLVGTNICQNKTKPMFVFTNIGNINLTWSIRLASNFPSVFQMKVNTVYNTSTSKIVNTSLLILKTNIKPAMAVNMWAWGNFFSAMPSQNTNRTLIHNGTKTEV